MAQENEVFQSGAVNYPLSSAAIRDNVKVVAPFVYHALGYFDYVLKKYMGTRFLASVAAAGLTDSVPAVVSQTLACVDPGTILQTPGVQLQFPLLALHKKRSVTEDKTLGYRHKTGAYELVYVLPPMTPAQMVYMSPLLEAIEDVLDNRIEVGHDPGWRPDAIDADTDASVWGSTVANMESVEMKGASYGGYPGTGDLFFPAIIFDIEAKQVASVGDVNEAYEDFEGVDATAEEQPPEGQGPAVEVANSVVDFSLYLSSVTPITGVITGGTTVTLTGTGFTDDCLVYVAGEFAEITSITATQIVCVTPAYPSTIANSADVTVANRNNQSATLEDGFTYTAV